MSAALADDLLSTLSDSQKQLVQQLNSEECGQSHLFADWPGMSPQDRTAVATQLEALDGAYGNGGLAGYVKNAVKLLENSRKGVNPLDGWEPQVPEGAAFEIGTDKYKATEAKGLEELGSIGFVLVAGGLGERLGYNGIKLELPTELATETCYLNYYIHYILSIQKKYGKDGCKLPLCIMVSNDTRAGTEALLKANNNFGMEEGQISIVQQGSGVPALLDNAAKFSMDETTKMVITKPHGHGDIHELLYTSGVAKTWYSEKGIKWLCFFQDTNGLAFHTLPLMLGVSKELDLVMNSLAVPRKAKQAIGGIAKLTKQGSDEVKTVNVEYNQLDPLLRGSGFPDGDVNDKETGFSPFPGNINQLLFQLKAYSDVLERTKGIMPEFVNPKYKDEAKTIFKKPARLECMMQDFPTVLSGDDAKKVGFTSISSDMCFSPVKNATSDGVGLQQKGTAPGVAATGEADQYGAFKAIMRSIGCQVEDAAEETHEGIKAVLSPQVVLKPDFVTCPAEYSEVFPSPDKVKISSKSSLVVSGPGSVVIESLDLDGALVIECPEGETVTVKDLTVKNDGWVREAADAGSPEYIRMRGYRFVKKETAKFGPGGLT
ncbi:UDP-sugar pyrophosphorylase [Seminavis robusta]|uniref:UTP-monosaccharide-1-phosphate uridylyltransferase n=1 Tax=Seminavis robusta TaxID=568900 RepID=A0A9N8DAY1_9STRA|nr:UDP-sugar pyrophosphorylase [Seminavis robusta]|eukprot:Sro39_g024300.1 UDP-sugar pyrophosphorylase (602) ;mRNA; r:131940-134150